MHILFEHFGEKVLVEVNNGNVFFSTTTYGTQAKAPIDGIRINYKGVVKEFPDLENSDNWREQAIKRFKEKISSMTDEKDIVSYIISELRGHNYIPLFKQRNGFRPEVIK